MSASPTMSASPKMSAPLATSAKRISFQGEPGANSHNACKAMYPKLEAVPCATFEDALDAVSSKDCDLAMIPIENSVAGRVADIHHLLPGVRLFIVAEHFERVRHQLMALPGASLETVKRALSHTHALGQCGKMLKKLNIAPVPEADTAGAARIVSEAGDMSLAAIASKLAAEIYGLKILAQDIEDEVHNTTRFVILANEPVEVKLAGQAGPVRENGEMEDGLVMTSFLFRVRNVPAALYKTMGGFATNGVNMTKLESYQLGGSFNATMFFADIEGHPDERRVALALEELNFFTTDVQMLGTYRASTFRSKLAAKANGSD